MEVSGLHHTLAALFPASEDKILWHIRSNQDLWSQQLAVTRHWPINNIKGMGFSAQSMLMAAHATMECVMPSLGNNCTVTGTVFSVQFWPGRYNELSLVINCYVCGMYT
jgi:hypothetical protein